MEVLSLLMMALCVGTLSGATVDVRPYKTLLLDLHNDYRRQVQPPAANMQAMVWNETLSTEAALWIRGCNFEHQRRGRGENLAFDSNPHTNEQYIADALKAWYDEKDLYRLGAQSCGRACHFTQMVWHKTTQVGCAMVTCPSLNAFGRRVRHAWYLGCFYDPKGNWIGERPYEPGTPCTQCLQGQSCDRKLCTGEVQEVCEDKKGLCKTWQTMGECNRNPNYMRTNCRKACGICKDNSENSGNTVCSDSNGNCRKWATLGECQKNKVWMVPNCPKSCNACPDRNGGRGDDNSSGSDGEDDRVVGGLACHNNSPQRSCRAWSLSGACDRHPQYMSRECRKECGLCRDETVCRNKLGCCADMKRRGYCRRYRTFMRENCQASCSRC